MKVLLLGSSGHVGRALSQQLAALGHELIVYKHSEGLQTLPSLLQQKQPDAIINLAGEPIASGAWTSAKKRRIHDSRVDTARALRQALSSGPGTVKTLLTASAIGYYGSRGELALSEASPPPESPDFLAEVCRDWESESLHPALRKQGVRTAALRFGMILSKNGGALPAMLPIFRLGLGGRLGSGQQWQSWIHLKDVVRGILHVLQSPLEGPINFVSPEPLRNCDFTQTLAATVQRPAFFPAPALALKTLLGGKSTLLLSSQRVLPQKLLESGFSFEYSSLQAALSAELQR